VNHPNAIWMDTRIELLLCPADPGAGTRVTPATNAVGVLTQAQVRGNYVANNGIGPMVEAWRTDMPINRPGGVFYIDSRTKIEGITDGTSNTVLVSEVVNVIGPDFRGQYATTDGTYFHANNPPNSSQPDWGRDDGCFSTTAEPCVKTWTVLTPRRMIYSARSKHSGGVNAVLGDGSVRFVQNTISQQTWQAASSPNGGEVLGSDW
jgi:prepilin-type processing-associated H-X9-DG protein